LSMSPGSSATTAPFSTSGGNVPGSPRPLD
jgi:hypothetical protein